jgi:hypothetical protein
MFSRKINGQGVKDLRPSIGLKARLDWLWAGRETVSRKLRTMIGAVRGVVMCTIET